jgi:hypothetical protein
MDKEIEQAAGNLADPNICKTDNWIAGAKYQAERIGLMEIELNHTKTLLASCEKALENRDKKAERMYSESDMLQALSLGFISTDETWEQCVAFAKEQFKNK